MVSWSNCYLTSSGSSVKVAKNSKRVGDTIGTSMVGVLIVGAGDDLITFTGSMG